jgi:hypothetical protein
MWCFHAAVEEHDESVHDHQGINPAVEVVPARLNQDAGFIDSPRTVDPFGVAIRAPLELGTKHCARPKPNFVGQTTACGRTVSEVM